MATEIVTRNDAKANGLTRYFTGQACKHGHIAERVVANGVCVVCAYDIEKRYREAHPEKMREKSRKYARNASPERKEKHREAVARWAAANPEKRREIAAKCREKNPEPYRASGKRWADKNRPKISAKNKAYKTAHADRLSPINRARVAKWAAENPERAAMHGRITAARRRTRLREDGRGTYTMAETEALLVAQNRTCPYCWTKLTDDNAHLDHINPVARGGLNVIENLQWTCDRCNRWKGAKDPVEFAARMAVWREKNLIKCEAV